MPAAMARGLTVEGFIRQLAGTFGTYRRQLMLADWRSVNNIEARKDVVKYIRKDRLPSMRVVADVEWEMSREYMYKCKVWSQTRPGEPMEERFINIMHDRLITTGEVTGLAGEMFREQSPKEIQAIKRVEVVGIYHRVETLYEIGE
jgi:hypothetical protein